MYGSRRYVFFSHSISSSFLNVSSGAQKKIKVHQKSFNNKYLASKYCKRISRLYKVMFKKKLIISRSYNLRKIRYTNGEFIN